MDERRMKVEKEMHGENRAERTGDRRARRQQGLQYEGSNKQREQGGPEQRASQPAIEAQTDETRVVCACRLRQKEESTF
jgi:hypothetical protein